MGNGGVIIIIVCRKLGTVVKCESCCCRVQGEVVNLESCVEEEFDVARVCSLNAVTNGVLDGGFVSLFPGG
jgi:hypothetical protein